MERESERKIESHGEGAREIDRERKRVQNERNNFGARTFLMGE